LKQPAVAAHHSLRVGWTSFATTGSSMESGVQAIVQQRLMGDRNPAA
jgi:hypothetical protein